MEFNLRALAGWVYQLPATALALGRMTVTKAALQGLQTEVDLTDSELYRKGFPHEVFATLRREKPVSWQAFPDGFAGLVLSSAVLHFARDDRHFEAMLRATWRVLKPGGMLFCRLASSIGMENQVQRVAGRRFRLPDGSERYLVDEALLLRFTAELGGQLADPLKTTVVQNQRCMTTWVVRKNA